MHVWHILVVHMHQWNEWIKSCKRYFRYTCIAFTISRTYTRNRHILYPFTVPPKIDGKELKCDYPALILKHGQIPWPHSQEAAALLPQSKSLLGTESKWTIHWTYNTFSETRQPSNTRVTIPPKLSWCRNMYFWKIDFNLLKHGWKARRARKTYIKLRSTASLQFSCLSPNLFQCIWWLAQ